VELRNKTILILSPQMWGTMFLSKHHYACSLAKRGNRVYFLNPPEYNKNLLKTQIETEEVDGFEHLKVIHHRPEFSNLFYFHSPFLYGFLMQRHVKKILQVIQEPVDIVWSFDIGNLYPLRFFSKSKMRVFHPVDEPLTTNAIAAADHSDIIISVTKEILNKYAHLSVPRYLISHGVSDHFFKLPISNTVHKQLHVGFSGNLTRQDIDRNTLLRLIKDYPEIAFHFWGVYDSRKSNISGGGDTDTCAFIQQLHEMKNVKLHGPVSTEILVGGYSEMDLFLICYDIQKDQSKGTNYHKVMEFLSTGKPIVSNNITAFHETQDLVYMSPERDSNKSLPELFRYVITNLNQLNSDALQTKRRAYAYDNLYDKQIDRIEAILQGGLVQA
jgi:glycosyltransferase involved in cell wall biosynthesis